MPLQTTDSCRRKIRVLLLTDEMEVGGTQRQIVHIARSLDRDRYEPTVAYFRNRSFLVDELEQAGVPVIEIPKSGRFDLKFIYRLRRFLSDGQFDVMHCFAFTGELWGAVARRLVSTQQRPVLITSVRGKYEWYSLWHWHLKRWASLESSQVIANSYAGGEYARMKMGLAREKIDIVYNGVGNVPENAISSPDSKSGAIVTALFVGRMIELKNIPVLLRAMRRLRDTGTPMRLLIAGDGPQRRACTELIAKLNLGESVELLGQRSDTSALMAAADFVILPSLREGLSNVILEAMMVGRPVIASAVGGNVELVEPMKTGLLFPCDDDAALADAIRRLTQDRELRERLGAFGRKRAIERYTVPAMVNSMQDFYSRCDSENPARSATIRR